MTFKRCQNYVILDSFSIKGKIKTFLIGFKKCYSICNKTLTFEKVKYKTKI